MIKKSGGIIIRIIRNIPEWHNIAINASQGCNSSKNKLKELNIHESEWASLSIDSDYIILNNGSLEDLKNNLKHIINDII